MSNHTSSQALTGASRGVPAYEKRGGYSSSSKLVTSLAPPPPGPAPGARNPAPAPGGSKKS